MQKPAKYDHLVHAGYHPGSVLIRSDEISERVSELADQISTEISCSELTIVAVMTGALFFTADLVRAMPGMMRMHLLDVSSYPGQSLAGGEVCVNSELNDDFFADSHVLIIDDVLDTGRTLSALIDRISACGPKSLRSCVLVSKPDKTRQTGGLKVANYVGFEIPDKFVVGYGMDFDDKYRNLPDICVLEPVQQEI